MTISSPPRTRWIGHAADVAFIVLALGFLGSLVFRGWQSPAADPRGAVQTIEVDSWDALLATAVSADSARLPVEIVVFIDHQCVFCAELHESLSRAVLENPGALRVSTHFFPLKQHRNAVLAANVAACADGQGQFEAMTTVLYARSSQLSSHNIGAFALEAGIGDTSSLKRCALATDTSAIVREGLNFARELRLQGTPTILVSGHQLTRIGSLGALNDYLNAQLQAAQRSQGK